MRPNFHFIPSIAAVTLAVALPVQAAFVVDQVQARREGADAVLEVGFGIEVQFLRMVATADGQNVVITYKLLSTSNQELGKGTQLMSLEHIRGLDRIRLTDEAERSARERRLVLKTGSPVAVSVRAGSDNRHIEIVLAGVGPGMASEMAKAPSGRASAAPLPESRPAIVAAPAPVPAAVPTPSPGPVAAEPALEAKAQLLIAAAREAMTASQPAKALESLDPLLNMPPTSVTREGQELAGVARWQLGQIERARAEFESYLQLYPQGEASDRVRSRLAALPKASEKPPEVARAPSKRPEEVTLGGSTSMTYFGGNGKARSQDFQDSPISGLPTTVGEPLLSTDRSRQLLNDLDVNWRRRNDDIDQRFVFRDSYTTDLERPSRNRNRLSSLYFDHKSRVDGWGGRIGRQSPLGGGVMGRFDGVQGYVTVKPNIKLGAVAGVPTDKFFQSERHFYGVSVDADRIVGGLGAGLFAIEQRIDGEVDRRAVGVDLRYFDGGLSVFSQLDYDIAVGGLNVATVQGTYISPGNTVYTTLLDRRSLASLSLGNALMFSDLENPGVLYTRISDRLAGTTVEALRSTIKRITPVITQAQAGFTQPINEHWQAGASVQLTNTSAIPPLPDVPGFETGRPATGDIVTASGQLIGLNLYSPRDTHVLALSVIHSSQYQGVVLAYNNSSYVSQDWQLEPSLQYYRDRTALGATSARWTPGIRLAYRGWKRWAIETALTYEIGRASRSSADPADPAAAISTSESSNRVNYSLGARFEF